MTAIIIFFGLIVADFIISAYRHSFGPTSQIDAIAVGSGYSITLDATPAHPFLAEYKQSISVYGGGPRDGSLLNRIEIPMNTGGRIRLGILVPTESSEPQVVLADRYATTRINLATQKSEALKTWRQPGLRPLGIISGESYPIKFIPCPVLGLLSSEEQQAIMSGDEFNGFCEVETQPGAQVDTIDPASP